MKVALGPALTKGAVAKRLACVPGCLGFVELGKLLVITLKIVQVIISGEQSSYM
jgi:hypothetical protein